MTTDAPQPRRAPPANAYVVATLATAAIIAVGLVGSLCAATYQLVTSAVALGVRRWLQRRPLRSAWVEDGPPARRSRAADAVFVVGATLGALAAVQGLSRGDVPAAALGVLVAVGAWGLAYAVSAATRTQLGIAVAAAVGAAGLGTILYAPELSAAALSGAAAVRLAGRAALAAATYLPASFTVEEVVFRGIAFPALRGATRGSAVAAALFSSILWGVWHVPTLATRGPATVATLVAWHTAVGVVLCWLWTRGRGLLPCAAAHALLDALRDAAQGG